VTLDDRNRANAIVRILRGKSAIAGAGFVIDRNHIMTCAHVVAAALGSEALGLRMEPPAGAVTIDFPNIETSKPLSARVADDLPLGYVAWAARGRPEWPADVAILRVDDPLPVAARPVDWQVESKALDSVDGYGFPENRRDIGDWLCGRWKGPVGDRVAVDMDDHDPVHGGVSGGPVWNLDRGGVAGMMVEVDPHDRHRAYLVGARELAKLWPLITGSAQTGSPGGVGGGVGGGAAGTPGIQTVWYEVTRRACCIDRREQYTAFRQHFRQGHRVGQPVVLLLRGTAEDEPGKFCDRLARYSCLDQLRQLSDHFRNHAGDGPEKVRIPWPRQPARNVRRAVLDLMNTVAAELNLATETPELVPALLASEHALRPVILFHEIAKDRALTNSDLDLLLAWAQAWRKNDSLRFALPPVILAVICFPAEDMNTQEKTETLIETATKRLEKAGVVVAPPMDTFPFTEVDDWLKAQVNERYRDINPMAGTILEAIRTNLLKYRIRSGDMQVITMLRDLLDSLLGGSGPTSRERDQARLLAILTDQKQRNTVIVRNAVDRVFDQQKFRLRCVRHAIETVTL